MKIMFVLFAGDMLVGLNDIDVTWVNIDELFRAICSQQEVSIILVPGAPDTKG